MKVFVLNKIHIYMFVCVLLLCGTFGIGCFLKDNIVFETTSTPTTGKIIILDAGHGVPDEGAFLLHKENKQLTFYK
ncbi:MAG: hypothetical protein IKL08_04400 [Clostridia bacterium]|nr:hypothetical protein [Clostridia bacterium]